MQSDGGLTPMNRYRISIFTFFFSLTLCTVFYKCLLFKILFSFNGSRAILSGPAGGVVGYTATTPYKPVIGFDMGGTSTDVSRYDGAFEHVFESITAGVTIQAPQVNIIHT